MMTPLRSPGVTQTRQAKRASADRQLSQKSVVKHLSLLAIRLTGASITHMFWTRQLQDFFHMCVKMLTVFVLSSKIALKFDPFWGGKFIFFEVFWTSPRRPADVPSPVCSSAIVRKRGG